MQRTRRERLTINIDRPDLDALHALARHQQFTTSEFLRRLIRRTLAQDAISALALHDEIMQSAGTEKAQ